MASTSAPTRSPGSSQSPNQSQSPSTTPPTSQELWPSANPPGQPALDDAAQKVKTALTAKYANWYSDIAVQEPIGPNDKTPYALLIYRVPNPALDAAARAAAPTTKLVFIDTTRSAAQCDAALAEVSKDLEYWRSRGLRMNSWGCQEGLVHIGIDQPATWKSALTARYGAEAIVVDQVAPAVAD